VVVLITGALCRRSACKRIRQELAEDTQKGEENNESTE